MISICTCVINARNRVKLFLEMLRKINFDFPYEICMTVDTRFDPDGNTWNFYCDLKKQYPNLKLIEFSKKDCIDYLTRLLSYYYETQLFPPEYLYQLNYNLLEYKENNFSSIDNNYLWISSGLLYNKAASISSGDILMFSPGELLYFLKFQELETLVNLQKENDIFYAKPNVIFLPLINKENLKIGNFPDEQTFLEMTYIDDNEMNMNELYVPDIFQKEYINLNDIDLLDKIISIAANSNLYKKRSICLKQCHGFHVMTRETYNKIGGFTEEWFGRAWSDDRMSSLGKAIYDKFALSYRFNICHYNTTNQHNHHYLYPSQYNHADFQKYFEKLRYEKPLRLFND